MNKKKILQILNAKLRENNQKYALSKLQEALEQHTFLTEELDNFKYKYYAFDWDDNIVNMPTKIFLKDQDGEEIGMSTDDYAEYRELVGKKEFRYKGKVVVGFAENPYRNFRYPTGDKAFLEDALRAEPAKAWGDFVECINNGSIFAIITARGHHPETLRSAVKQYINAYYKGISKDKLIDSLDKYREAAAMSTYDSDDEKIEEYLNLCRFYPVTYGGGDPAGPEKAKVKAMKEFIAYVKDLNQQLDVKVGFSDDDPGNIKHMKKNFGGESNLTLKYTGHLPLDEVEKYQKAVKSKHKRLKFRLLGHGNKKAAKKGAPFSEKPSYKRSKSAPPGAGGS